LLRRRLARRELSWWCRAALEPVSQAPALHHLKIIERLEALSRGEIDRLMVLAPPGSAKSTYISTLFPVWWFAQHPQSSIIAASHTAELAERFGRRVRNLILEHAVSLGYGLSADNAAAGRWETDSGGEYFAAGVMGPITGRRADLVIIDDPVKSRQEADSETVQDRTWDWWKADLTTRLKPGARVVLVMTRWSQADLGGRLLDEMAAGGKRWEVLKLPMVAEADDVLGRDPGEVLWSDWFTPDMVDEARRDARTFSALYQQNPVPEDGTYFQRAWLRPAITMPERDTLRVYGASDYAVTQNGGDFTCHVVVGVDPDRRMWLLDLWRGQTTSDQWVDAFCDLVAQWRPIGWAEEQGQIRAGIGPFLVQRMRARSAFVARTQFPTRGDKAVRAQSIRGRMALDGLYLPAVVPWRAELESELIAFPAGKHDDQVDALGLLGQLLDMMVPGMPIRPPDPPSDSWDRAFQRAALAEAPDSWRVA
jgi:predicted phage terminase large subunit-like protein